MGIAAKDRFREERYKQVLRQKEYPPSTIVVRGKTLYYLGVSDARDLICDMAIKGHGKDVEYQQAIYCDIYSDMYEALIIKEGGTGKVILFSARTRQKPTVASKKKTDE